MGNEYVIVVNGREFYSADGWTKDVGRARKFGSVTEACDTIACQVRAFCLTIHRVIREPARCEEVPLKDALNEGLPLVVRWCAGGHRCYQTSGGATTYSSREAARHGELSSAINFLVERVKQYRSVEPSGFEIVGVREVPGRAYTEEVK